MTADYPKKSNKMISVGKFVAIAIGTVVTGVITYCIDWARNRKKKPVEPAPETPEEKPE